jgi:hypothetical protein
MLVDLAAPMSELGSKYFLLQLSRQRTLMTELAEAVGRMIRELEDDGAFHSALQSMKQTLHQLSGVEKAWNRLMGTSQPVMPSLDAGGAVPAGPVAHTPRSNGWPLNLGMLLELLVSKLVAAVLEKSDISVEGGQRCNNKQAHRARRNVGTHAHFCYSLPVLFALVLFSASRIYQLFTLISQQYPNLDVGAQSHSVARVASCACPAALTSPSARVRSCVCICLSASPSTRLRGRAFSPYAKFCIRTSHLVGNTHTRQVRSMGLASRSEP